MKIKCIVLDRVKTTDARGCMKRKENCHKLW